MVAASFRRLPLPTTFCPTQRTSPTHLHSTQTTPPLLSRAHASTHIVVTPCSHLAGPQLEAGSVDYLCTTPPQLLHTVDNVLALYDSTAGAGSATQRSSAGSAQRGSTMAGEAAALMNPQVCVCVSGRGVGGAGGVGGGGHAHVGSAEP